MEYRVFRRDFSIPEPLSTFDIPHDFRHIQTPATANHKHLVLNRVVLKVGFQFPPVDIARPLRTDRQVRYVRVNPKSPV